MDFNEMYINQKYHAGLSQIIEKLPIVRPISHILNGSKVTERKQISKLYKKWLVVNHPDKSSGNALNLFVIKEYGMALLHSDEFEEQWKFMELSENTLANFENMEQLTIDDLQLMSNNLSDILQFIHNCRLNEIVVLSDDVSDICLEISRFLDLAVTRYHAQQEGICCLHSTLTNMIKKIDCADCVDLIILSSDDENEACVENIKENINGNIYDNIGEISKVTDHSVIPLGERSVKDLKSMAVNLNIDTSCCIEKADIVKLVQSKLPFSSAEKCNSKRTHRKKENPERRKSNMNIWVDVKPENVTELPYDIDGEKVYLVPFSLADRMKSSRDGRPWKTWVTSRSKHCPGIRRKTYCKGSMICNNLNCHFIKMYNGKKNRIHFDKNSICKICGSVGVLLPCKATKLWEFDDEKCLVTVYHEGNHTCFARELKKDVPENIREKFKNNSNIPPGKLGEDIIIETLKEQDVKWEDVIAAADSVVDNEQMKYAKKMAIREEYPEGHSFEAVTNLKSKVTHRDPFYIYRLNDKNMNSDLTFVMKCSKVQLKLAIEMNDGFLKNEYCFLDGTFKRCPGYVTLGLFVYVPVLRKMVKICSMECESESTSNWKKFWSLFMDMLKEYSGNTNYQFIPCGWSVDEAGGIWEAIRIVFGQEAIEKMVSCEYHFQISVDKWYHSLSKVSGKEFKDNAMRLMTANTGSEYEQAYNNIVSFIERKPQKRGFLKKFLNFWHPRRGHFSRAFKNQSGPSTNLSETFHSRYVKTQTTGLKLLDAAYRDIAYAIKLERSIELFSKGANCQGYGPSQKQSNERTFSSQKRKAESYAEDLLNDPSFKEQGPSKVYPNSKHRPSNPLDADGDSSSEDEMCTRKAKNMRGERKRSAKSKKFTDILRGAQESNLHFTKLEDAETNRKTFQVTEHSRKYSVVISDKPSCNCKSFELYKSGKGQKVTCKHIVYTLLNYFNVPSNSSILAQVAFTCNEIEYILSGSINNIDTNSSTMNELSLSEAEIKSIFEGNPKNNQTQLWFVDKIDVRKNAKCCSCKSTMPIGKYFIFVNGLYIPRNQNFVIDRTFYFCALPACIQRKPYMSNINESPLSISQTPNSKLTIDDVSALKARGLPIF